MNLDPMQLQPAYEQDAYLNMVNQLLSAPQQSPQEEALQRMYDDVMGRPPIPETPPDPGPAIPAGSTQRPTFMQSILKMLQPSRQSVGMGMIAGMGSNPALAPLSYTLQANQLARTRYGLAQPMMQARLQDLYSRMQSREQGLQQREDLAKQGLEIKKGGLEVQQGRLDLTRDRDAWQRGMAQRKQASDEYFKQQGLLLSQEAQRLRREGAAATDVRAQASLRERWAALKAQAQSHKDWAVANLGEEGKPPDTSALDQVIQMADQQSQGGQSPQRRAHYSWTPGAGLQGAGPGESGQQ